METTPSRTEHPFELTGGRLCLDFVNTVSGDRLAAPRERIPTYRDLLAWARQAGAVDAALARRLAEAARGNPDEAAEVHRAALAFREALFRTLLAAAERATPHASDVALVSANVARALCHRRLVRREEGFALDWADAPGALDGPIWRVASSAADLLVSATDLERVRVCGLHETKECSWVFLDGTRARTRRWCSMRDCGNKAKARRHYERVKGSG